MEKQITNVQFAVAALVATLFSLGMPIALGLAKLLPMEVSGIAITSNATVLTVGLFALPLIWWRRKAGYVCGILVGAVNTLGNAFAIAQGNPFLPGMPTGTIAIFVSQTIVSVLVIVFCIRAWRER